MLPAFTARGKCNLMLAVGALASATVFGQATQIWTGGGDGTNIDVAANWGGTQLNTGDTGEFNGTKAGPLNLNYSVGNYQSGPGGNGYFFYLNSAQTSPISLNTATAGQSVYLALSGITIDPGAGTLHLGSTNAAHVLALIRRPSGGLTPMINNSANKAIIDEQILWAGGGGANWGLDFSGSGDWYATNYLVNNNGPAMSIELDGPGNLYWNPLNPNGVGVANGFVSPIVINGGTMLLLGNHPKLSNQAWTLNGNFCFNAPSQAQTLSGIFSGSGSIIVSGGTLTLSGQSTYVGTTVLTNGELIVNGTENAGSSGPLGTGYIDFEGGTLGFSLNNTFDYSSRFIPFSNEAYSIDTAGQNVTFATGLTSPGGILTKVGTGALTLAADATFNGLTTVSSGKLVIQGAYGTGNITVADGAALGVVENGTPIHPANLTVGAVSGGTLEFNNLTNTSTAPIAATTVVANGPITININSGVFKTIGQTFPLVSWSSGSAPAVSLGVVNGAAGTLSTNANKIVLTITSTPLVWSGGNNGSWDTSTAGNWLQSGNPVTFANGALALFDDSLTGTPSVAISGSVQPASVTLNNATTAYTITSSFGNSIDGTAALTQNGSGTTILTGGANTFTGVTTVSGGILSVSSLANSGSASDIGAATSGATNLVLNGGTLRYTGTGASIDHLFTVGPSGGTIDSSGSVALSFTNTGAIALNGSGPHTLVLTGTLVDTNTIAGTIANSSGGATAVTKDAAGTWVLAGNNTYSGVTTINNGRLQIGLGGTSGSIGSGNVVDNRNLYVNRSGSLTLGGVISGTGSVTEDGGGKLILTGNNTYSGGTIISNGVLQVGNGGAGGKLAANSAITVVNPTSTFVFDSTTPMSISGFNVGIQGLGNLVISNGCSFSSIDANSFTGWTYIGTGATLTPTYGNEGEFYSSMITNNGTISFTRQDNLVFGISNSIVGTGKLFKDNNNANSGDITLAGTDTYTGGTWIGGGGFVIGDGINAGFGSIVGQVIFTNSATAFHNNRYFEFDPAPATTVLFTNNIISKVTDGSATADQGRLEVLASVNGAGSTVILTGNNSYPGTTIVDAGQTLQVGNNGAAGSIGSGAITDNGVLVFARTDSVTYTNAISGTGILVQASSGTTTLTGANTLTGDTTVSNGTLVVVGTNSNFAANLNIDGGKLVMGGVGLLSSNTIAGFLNINAGMVTIAINESVPLTNTLFVTGNSVIYTGGTLQLINYGPALHVGDKLTIFSSAVVSSGPVVLSTPGFTVVNNLSVDGSVTVTGISPAPAITTSVTGGNQLNLSWPSAYTGYLLQAQTNTVAKGLVTTNWVTIPGTDAGSTYTATINKTNGVVFYRLAP